MVLADRPTLAEVPLADLSFVERNAVLLGGRDDVFELHLKR
jgi:hypothetical protein